MIKTENHPKLPKGRKGDFLFENMYNINMNKKNSRIIFVSAILLLIIALALRYIVKFNLNKNGSLVSPTLSTISTSPSILSSLPAISTLSTSSTSIQTATLPTSQYNFADPVKDFKSRVTKKPFGIYITPQNSPIQPEKFSGYHTGADAEYQDVTDDVFVYAIADGKVVLSKTASGYGGVFMIQIQLNGASHTVLYGHIRPSSLPKVGSQVTKGQQLAVLGTGYSSETDNERRHLHFAILASNNLNIKGYVQTQAELAGWYNPLNYL